MAGGNRSHLTASVVKNNVCSKVFALFEMIPSIKPVSELKRARPESLKRCRIITQHQFDSEM